MANLWFLAAYSRMYRTASFMVNDRAHLDSLHLNGNRDGSEFPTLFGPGSTQLCLGAWQLIASPRNCPNGVGRSLNLEKVIAMLFADRKVEVFHDLQHIFPNAALF